MSNSTEQRIEATARALTLSQVIAAIRAACDDVLRRTEDLYKQVAAARPDNEGFVSDSLRPMLDAAKAAYDASNERMLNAYNDGATRYLSGDIDPIQFREAVQQEICELFGKDGPAQQLLVDRRDAFGSLRKAYTEFQVTSDAKLSKSALQGGASTPSTRATSFLFGTPEQDVYSGLSRASRLLGGVEDSERLILLTPSGAPYEGLGLKKVSLADALNELENDGLLAAPQFRGSEQLLSEGILRISDGTRFAIGLDGSIGLRRRLSLDRRGHGQVVARGDIGIYTSIEQLLDCARLAQALCSRTNSGNRTWWLRHELHGVSGRHLMDDPARERRVGAEWSQSSPCAERNVVSCGALVVGATDVELGTLLDEVATEIAVPFRLHPTVRLMKIGSSLLVDVSRSGTSTSTADPPALDSRSLIDQTAEAAAWVRAELSQAKSPFYERYLSGVAWANSKAAALPPADQSKLAESLLGEPLTHDHDPGRRIGKTVATRAFIAPTGVDFVAAVYGLYSNKARLSFAQLGVDVDPLVPPPSRFQVHPASKTWKLPIASDPRDVDPRLIEAIAAAAPLPIDKQQLSLNSADGAVELITVALPFVVLASPIIAGVDDLYQRLHAWLGATWRLLSGRPRIVFCIQSFQRGCRMQFIFRGEADRLSEAHERLALAAAKADRVIVELIERGFVPADMTYECDGPERRWYPSQVFAVDGAVISARDIPDAAQLGTSLSVGVVLSREEENVMVARDLNELRPQTDLMASVAFLHLANLKAQTPDRILAALTRLVKICGQRDVYVLNAPTGAVLICPHEPGKPNALTVAESVLDDWDVSPELRVGITSGKVSIVQDVDRLSNAIGTRVNIAARLATNPGNPGIAVHDSFTEWADTTLLDLHWLHVNNRVQSDLAGKQHDAKFVCYLHSAAPRTAHKRHADVVAVPAVFVAYDLAGFSKGDLSTLRARFSALSNIISRLQVSETLPLGQFLLSPGGDGGVLVFCGSGLSITSAVRVSEQLAEWARSESSQTSSERSVVPRLSVHYGQVMTFTNAYGVLRPTGRDLFIADDLASDEAARKYRGIIMSGDVAEAVANDSDAYMSANFDELPKKEVRRFARKSDLIVP